MFQVIDECGYIFSFSCFREACRKAGELAINPGYFDCAPVNDIIIRDNRGVIARFAPIDRV